MEQAELGTRENVGGGQSPSRRKGPSFRASKPLPATIEDSRYIERVKQMMREVRDSIVEETVSSNPVFDANGLSDHVERALLDYVRVQRPDR
jgi:hypothetical protein